MLHTTRGIVLTHYKFSESSLVVHIFTEELGMQSYLVNGVWKKNAKLKSVLFQPLTLLDLVVYYKPNRGMQRIKEANLAEASPSILNNVIKATTGLFMAELLHKTLKTEIQEEELFRFAFLYIRKLELYEAPLSMFVLEFMRAYSVVLGVCPQGREHSSEVYFDMLNGQFVSTIPLHAYYLNPTESDLFNISIQFDHYTTDNEPINKYDRQLLTDYWIRYFLLHFENIKELKSLKVLRDIFA